MVTPYAPQLPQELGFKTVHPQEAFKIYDEQQHPPPVRDESANNPIPFIISMAPVDRYLLQSLATKWNLSGTSENNANLR